jgi:hypothetical protein
MISVAVGLLILLGAAVASLATGQLVVRVVERYTLLAAFNLYPAIALAGSLTAIGVRSHSSLLTRGSGIALLALGSMAGTATRHRSHALSAGGSLRAHELERRWFWQPRPRRGRGERVYLAAQGEVVHHKPWSTDVPYVSLEAPGQRRTPRHSSHAARLPLGEGQHVFVVGATGAGKTTTARRVVCARVLAQRSSLVILDQKGDGGDVEQMRRLAAAAGVPFVLFDSEDPGTDRWQPLWGSPEMVAARATEAIKASEPYYHDVLRKHLDVVCRVLHAAGRWPPSVPFLIDACEPINYPAVRGIADQLGPGHEVIARRAQRHERWVASRNGTEDLSGAVLRIETALALSTSRVVTPRPTPSGEHVAVRLADALRQRAVVMWRTHADTMPDAAAALTAVALADLHASAELDIGPWTLLLDEFGAVINTNGQRALAILQRARSHHGQAVVITQSIADVEALTETPGLLESLTDNFAAVVAHRQTSPDSRDWLARLMGTRELWQSTNQTDLHGSRASGRGSARRVHEFRVAPDSFAQLGRGEAVIYSPEGLQAHQVKVASVQLPAAQPQRIDQAGGRDAMEIHVHPDEILEAQSRSTNDATRGTDGHGETRLPEENSGDASDFL